MENKETHFDRLYGIIKQLRHPEEGCPWDLKQTASTMRKSLVEEAYECIDAIDKKDDENLKEELGDLFLILLMITRIKEQESRFTIEEVLNTISEKLIRRHPHVFGDTKTDNVNDIIKNWDYIKENIEGKKPIKSVLEKIPASMPPLDKAVELQKKAAKVGFEWNNVEPVWEKLEEEIAELKVELKNREMEKAEREMGDVIFTVVNIARMMKIDPSLALNTTNNKFTKRFREMERELKNRGIDIKKADLELMDSIWDTIKIKEKQ